MVVVLRALGSARSTLKIRCAGPPPRRIIVGMFRQPFALSSAVAGAVDAALVLVFAAAAAAVAVAAVTGARS